MTDVWESAWDRLSETFRRVASSLSSSCPGMTWSAGHSDNQAFPFRAYAAFNRGSPESVDVVASVDFADRLMTNSGSLLTLALTMVRCCSTDQTAALTSLAVCSLRAEKSIPPL